MGSKASALSLGSLVAAFLCTRLLLPVAAQTAPKKGEAGDDAGKPAAGAKSAARRIAMPFAKPPIPEGLRAVVGVGDEKRYQPRIRAARQLRDQLSQEDLTALYWFLHRKVAEDGLSAGKLNAVKSEVANTLLKQRETPKELGWHLVAMWEDKGQDAMWRDYCVRFLGSWYPHAGTWQEREAIKGALWDAAAETDGPTAGTALIALANNAEQPGISTPKIKQEAVRLAGDKGAAEAARITALQICAELECTEAASVARKLAKSAESVPLRASAIAAIGVVGEAIDVPTLVRFTRSRDARIKSAATAALKRLREKRSR